MSNESVPGLLPAMAVGILVALIAWGFYLIGKVALNGPRNHAVGFRLPALMGSDDAWKAGHAAALPWLRAGAWVVTVAALATIAAAGSVIAYIIALAVAVLALFIQILGATLKAYRAGRTAAR